MNLIDQFLADESVRLDEFPVARDSIFMAHAGVTVLPRRTARAMQTYVEEACTAMQEFAAAWRATNETRALAAKLIGAKASEISLLGPTTLGLALVANGLPWQAGDEVVCYLDDYPANVYPWMELQRRGVVVKFLKPDALGAITPEVVEQALTARTRLVSLASCHFLTGNRIQIDVIGRMLRERGIWFCLDAIQTVGAFETTVEHVDFLSADSHKWMLGPMAAGIVYVKEELQDVLRPTLLGSWNVRSPNFIAQETIEFESGGRRYEPGALNLAGTLGMRASIELIAEIGVHAIGERLLALRNKLRSALSPLGFQLIEHNDGCLPSGICTFAHPTRDLAQAFAHLAAHKVTVSHRHDRNGRGYLRLSPHFYNTEREVDRIAELLAE